MFCIYVLYLYFFAVFYCIYLYLFFMPFFLILYIYVYVLYLYFIFILLLCIYLCRLMQLMYYAILSRASFMRSSLIVSENLIYPSPYSPKPEPGVTTIPLSLSSDKAKSFDDTPAAGTFVHT